MLRFLLLFTISFLLTVPVLAQADSVPAGRIDILPNSSNVTGHQQDTSIARQTTDSISKRPAEKWKVDSSIPFFIQVLNKHPYFNFKAAPVAVHSGKKEFRGKETLFYVMLGFLLLFAFLRTSFAKYFNDLFRVFFRTTLKQRQIKEQLMQTPVPSFAFNIFFIAGAGLYADFLLHYLNLAGINNFWLVYFYCCLGLSIIYFIKFVGLKVCGWLFNIRSAADAYIFIVFIINKAIGIFLLPVLILIAFSAEPVTSVVYVLSWIGIGLLFGYRFILGYATIRKEVRFNIFHFFLYLCAFELAPLLLIYKLLLLFF